MNPSELTLDQLLRLLPEQEELEELRAALFRAGVPDPAAEWSRSEAFATVERRLVEPRALEAAIDEAERAHEAYGARLFSAYRSLIRAYRERRHGDAAGELMDLAQVKEDSGLFASACRYLEVALAIVEPLPDKSPQIHVLQRLARVSRSAGDLTRAAQLYARSGELARDTGELRGAALARVGEGYTLALQGHWAEAEEMHRAALGLLEGGDADHLLEVGQIYNNLGYFAARQHRLTEADQWLTRARSVWGDVISPADLGVYHHCMALLLKASGDPAEARAHYRAALELPLTPAMRAGITIDLAELCLDTGDPAGAERWGRLAEEEAISSRSPYLLGRVYQVRGNVARDAGDDEGFIFYEKALEIARDRGLRLLEGETLLDYASLRSRMGEREEADSYVERAREILEGAGASPEGARADELPALAGGMAEEAPPPPGG